ncbi:hypothetical protein, partial [Salmonella enterica]|uniref:hypothetical protein n=1 Tax=Salmonella enterica TaxID=28901 RepID=UPI00398C5FE8
MKYFTLNTPRIRKNHEMVSNEDKSDIFAQQFQILDRTVSIVSIFQRPCCFPARFDAMGRLLFTLFVSLVLELPDIIPEIVFIIFIIVQANQAVIPFAGATIFSLIAVNVPPLSVRP